MTVYTFRVSLADDDNIYRDVEITGPQTFSEFSDGVFQAFNKDPDAKCQFFKSNDDWKKGKPLSWTAKTTLKSLIEKANTKWIGEPSTGLYGNYYIELKGMDGEHKEEESYPRVIKKNGMLPGALLDTTDEEFSSQVVEDPVLDLDDDDFDDYDENF